MRSQTDPLFLLYGIVVAQLLLLLLTLGRSRRTARPRVYFLAGLVVLLTGIAAEFLLTWSGYLSRLPWMMGTGYALPYLIGPAIAGYVAWRPTTRWRAAHLWHALPFLVALVYVSDFLLLPAAEKLTHYRTDVATESYFSSRRYIVGAVLKAFHLLAYYWVIRRWLRRRDRQPDAIGRGLLASGGIFGALLLLHAGLLAVGWPGYALVYCTLVLLMGVLAIWLHWRIAAPGPPVPDGAAAVPTAPAAPKYAKSGAAPDELAAHAARLATLMREERPWQDAGLRLAELAARLDLTPQLLSQVLNQQIGEKFPDYVNRHRVAYARTQIEAGRRGRTLLELAYAAGFNSKNSFNRAFRKFTGVSPSAYQTGGSSDRMGRTDGAADAACGPNETR